MSRAQNSRLKTCAIAAVAAVLLLVTAASTNPAQAQTPSATTEASTGGDGALDQSTTTTGDSTTTTDPDADVKATQAAIEARQAELASQVDGLKADNATVLAELDRLAARIVDQTAAVDAAKVDVERADAAALAAADRHQEAVEVHKQRRTQLAELATSAYISGPDVDSSVLLGGPVQEMGKRRVLAEVRLDQVSRATQDLRTAEQAAEKALAESKRAAAVAADAEASHRASLDELNRTSAEKQALAEQLALRIDEALGESATLTDQDRALVAELGRRAEVRRIEEEERQRAEAQRLAEEAAARRAAAEAEAAAALAAANANAGPGQTIVAGGSVQTAWVRGIEVNVSIAPNLERMMAAAEKDGIILTGGGYRTMAEQIAIRRAVCGPTEYDIWVKPSWECSPPVARPGFSMHQLGLAIDFTLNGGDLVRNGGDRVVLWLKAHAAEYGFYNLPSEPWHWSVNGH